MRRRYHHGDLRQALLATTLDLVRTAGPQAVTLREVAARAGVSEAAPYHHFASKAHLLLELATTGYRLLADRLSAAMAAGANATARDRLVAGSCAYVRFALDEPGYFRLLFGAHVVELAAHPESRAIKEAGGAAARHLREGVAAFLRETRARTDARMLERIVWGQIHGVAWLAVEQELQPTPTHDETVALVRRGIELLLAGVTAPRAARGSEARPARARH
jgi:AcrR family transcriptional regulator